MKIYNLNDEFGDEACNDELRDDGLHDDALRITEMKQGVKNPNRINVFVNGKFYFSLDVSQVVDLKLKVGLEVSRSQLAEFKNASDFGKLYQRTLEWVLVRPRSIRETREYLIRKLKQPSLETSMFELLDAIIFRLVDKKYLDDKTFAKWYVENRFVKKGISKKRLQLELMKKGVANEIIDEVLNARSDEEEILKIIAKKRGRYDDKKLIEYLCRQGFSYELARDLVQTTN